MKTNSRVLAGYIGGLAFIFISFTLLAVGIFVREDRSSAPREAPEAERILGAQAAMPFQVLIPGYLPGGFDRQDMIIDAGQTGPQGEPLIQLTYATAQGYTLQLSEWIPAAETDGKPPAAPVRCICICRSTTQCDMLGAEIDVGHVRVRLALSAPNLLSSQQVQLVLDTLGPALNRQVFSRVEDVPPSYSLPPAVAAPLNAAGEQEVTLVVTPEGYAPAHFSVRKGVPVRLIFRQLGQVGCGNELIFQWGRKEAATLILTSPADKQVLEFVPQETGEFPFNCPHGIYRGAVTVTD